MNASQTVGVLRHRDTFSFILLNEILMYIYCILPEFWTGVPAFQAITRRETDHPPVLCRLICRKWARPPRAFLLPCQEKRVALATRTAAIHSQFTTALQSHLQVDGLTVVQARKEDDPQALPQSQLRRAQAAQGASQWQLRIPIKPNSLLQDQTIVSRQAISSTLTKVVVGSLMIQTAIRMRVGIVVETLHPCFIGQGSDMVATGAIRVPEG